MDDNTAKNKQDTSSTESGSSEDENVARTSSNSSQERIMLSKTKPTEVTNLSKASTSLQRPISPPPPKITVKGKINNVETEKDTSGNPSNLKPTELNLENKILFGDEDEDDTLEEIIMGLNLSGSVLARSPNPYNKEDRIRQANIELFKKDVNQNKRTKIRFCDSINVLESESSVISAEIRTDELEEINATICGTETYNGSNRRKVNDDKAIPNEDSSSSDSSEESSNVESDGNEVDSDNVIVSKDVKCETPDNTNSSRVLLVMVPDIHSMQDATSVQSDYSSSENDDVCFGHRMKETNNCISSTKDVEECKQIGGNTFQNKDTIVEKAVIKEEKQQILINKDEENAIVNSISCELSNVNLNDVKGSDNISTNSVRNISVSPINNTGIKIKITCADCCDKFSKSTNGMPMIKNESEKCKHCESSCDLADQSKNNLSYAENHKHCKGSVTLKSASVINNNKTDSKPEGTTLKKNVTNISINLQALTDSDISQCNNNFCGRSFNYTIEKRKNMRTKVKFLKKIDVNNYSKFTRNSFTNNNITGKKKIIAEPLCLNDNNNSNKENFKVSKSIITRSIKKVVIRNDTIDCNHVVNGRPKSCNLEERNKLHFVKRPETAPLLAKRGCCAWEQSRLPKYNGFRSEYGLTEKQLQERKRVKDEKTKIRKIKKEEKLIESERKRKENEQIFSAWLAKKNELAKQKRLHTQVYPGYKFRRYSAPANHLLKNNCFLQKRGSVKLGRHFSVDKLLIDATPQEKRTYRIYLGLGTE